MSLPVVIVDRRDNLLASRSFVLTAYCRQCGEQHVSLFAMGQEAKPFQDGDRCPQCLSDGKLSFGTMLDAHNRMSGRSRAFFFDDPKAGFVRAKFSADGVDLVLAREFGATAAQTPGTACKLPNGAGIYDQP